MRIFQDIKIALEKDIDRDIRELCFDGNDLREDTDIKERLNCYLKWDNIPDDVKNIVKEKCDFLTKKILKAKNNAVEIVSGMTMLERKYLIKAAEKNCNTPFGNENNKLWEEL